MDLSELENKMCNIMKETQHSKANHQKSILLLKQIYKKVPVADFYTTFEKFIYILLSKPYKPINIKVDRSISFCVDFCVSVSSISSDENHFEESEFFLKFCNLLLQTVNASKQVIRYRSCQILQMTFEKLLHVDLNDDLCTKLEDAMLKCLEEDKYVIRVIAVTLLKHFQNASVQEDSVGNALKRHMTYDASPYVRKACIDVIAPKRDVILLLIERARDVDVNVRLAAFKKVTNYPKHFKIKEKQMILESGLNDDSQLIKNYIEKTLVVKWLENYDDNYLDLVKSLKLLLTEKYLNNSSKVIRNVLKLLFKCKTKAELLEVLEYDDDKMLINLCNWESLIYWSCLIEYAKTNDIDDLIEYILPDAVNLCGRIKKCLVEESISAEDCQEFDAILIQLFHVLNNCDFSDPCSERCLKDTIQYVLTKYTVTQNAITNMFRCLENFISVVDYTNFVNEIISLILYSDASTNIVNDKTRAKIEQHKRSLIELQCSLDQKILEEDFNEASSIRIDMEIINSTIEKLDKELAEQDLPDLININVDILEMALNVLIVYLQSLKIMKYSTILATIKSEIVNVLLLHENPIILSLTMKCYTLLALLSKDVANECMPIISAPLIRNNPDVNVLKTSIFGVVDILLIHGTELVVSPYTNDLTDSFNEVEMSNLTGVNSLTQIVQCLVNLTDQQDIEIYSAALHALVLLTANKIVWSSSLFTRLILRWFMPSGDDDDDDYQTSQQLLGCLLHQLPVIYNDVTCVQNAVISIISTILDAPKYSALRDIQLDNVILLLINLSSSFKNGLEGQIHLAYRLLQEINNHISNHVKNQVYSKALIMLNMNAVSKSAINELSTLCNIIIEELSKGVIKNNLNKFVSKLSLIDSKRV